MGAAAGPNVVDDGLVLSLDASSPKNYNVGVSTNWTDRVGGNNGTLVGGTYHSDGPFVGAGYVEFDGLDDYLSISSASSLGGFSGDFTIEFWFKGDNQAGFAVFLESWVSSTSSTQRWAIQAEGGGTTNMIWVRDGLVKFTTSGIDVFDNAWHHHAVVRDGSTITYYIDGVSRGSETHSAALTSGTDFIIGEFSSGDYEIEGYLSNVRIIDGTALYTSAFTPPTKSLTAVPNTVLLTCQGNTITDASSSGHTITANGNAAANLGFPASAFEFDGSNYDHILSAANPTLNWGTGDFTVELWANVSSSTSFGTLFATEVNAQQAQNNTFTIAMNSSRRLGVIAYSTYSISNSSATKIPQNTWTHIVVTRQGTTLTLYIDKSSVATGTSSINYVAGGYSIGALPRSLSNTNFTGKVSNVRVYKGKALTLAEIEQNYNANKGRYA